MCQSGVPYARMTQFEALKSHEAGQVYQSGVPYARVTQVEDMDVREVVEERQVFVGHRRASQGHNAHIGLPDAVATERLDAGPRSPAVRSFAQRAIWLLLY